MSPEDAVRLLAGATLVDRSGGLVGILVRADVDQVSGDVVAELSEGPDKATLRVDPGLVADADDLVGLLAVIRRLHELRDEVRDAPSDTGIDMYDVNDPPDDNRGPDAPPGPSDLSLDLPG